MTDTYPWSPAPGHHPDLTRLSPVELTTLLAGVECYTAESVPYFDGMTLGQVLDYLLDTPNEYAPDDHADWLDLAPEGERRRWLSALLVADFVCEGGGDGGPSPYGPTDLAELLLEPER